MKYTKLWLDYTHKSNAPAKAFSVSTDETGIIIDSIRREFALAFSGMYGAEIVNDGVVDGINIKLAADKPELGAEGYNIVSDGGDIRISSGGANGLLYGTFELIRLMKTDRDVSSLNITKIPSDPLRMVDHWDNMDGSIERGYSGKSFFFEDNSIIVNERTVDYARFMASVGINCSVINNVNVRTCAPWLISRRYRNGIKALAKVFEAYGIKLFLSINYASPVKVGGLSTADPLNKDVAKWWADTAKDLFEDIPNFGGFLVKADSEGEFGPFAYGRDHAEGANVLAEAVRPYGGIVVWRCFVYNCQQDWRNHSFDRACASYNTFIGLDGKFMDNVVLQIKNGPVDFQVREPVHPLFGALKKTNMIIEFQIAQEYTGQQMHVCYLPPMFREILDFKTYNGEKYDTVKDLVSGKAYGNRVCGMAAVINTGNDENWTGHDLAAANLYGYASLAFDDSADPETIAHEWISMTYGNDPQVQENIGKILMMSWRTYEKYNAPLGIGWMCNPSHHFGPNVEGYEYDRWGTYNRASHSAIGVDRSSRGTGYAQQYFAPNAEMYDKIETCPEELLLFFHRVRFDHVLSSGETLLQHIYDTHFEGVEDVEEMEKLWEELEGKLDAAVYNRVGSRIAFQLEHAKEWRDRINTYFWRLTEVPDIKGRKIFE